MKSPRAARTLLAFLVVVLSGCATIDRSPATSDPEAYGERVTRGAPESDERSPTPRVSSPFTDFSWPGDPVFRSAGRIRALGQEDEGGIAPRVQQARLRDHFAAVLVWLEAHEMESLAIAIGRLEIARGERFEGEQRTALLTRLQSARAHQRATLARYAERGLFPLHPTPGAPSQPIFVDGSGTACAVGYLMRVDGWGVAVEAIRASNNGVFVSDLADGPVLAWAAESGLLIEEAALIQPTYTPPPGNVDLAALAEPGASVSQDDLTISRFSAFQSSTPLFDPESIETIALDLTNIRLTVADYYTDGNGGVLQSAFPASQGSRPPFLFWNAGYAGGFLNVAAAQRSVIQTEIAFDVAPRTPGQAIDAAQFGVYPDRIWSQTGAHGTDLLVEMEIRSRSGELLAHRTSTDPWAPVTFAPQDAISVVVRGTAPAFSPDAIYWGNFRQDFRLVPIPEPGMTVLIGAALAVLSFRPRLPEPGRAAPRSGR